MCVYISFKNTKHLISLVSFLIPTPAFIKPGLFSLCLSYLLPKSRIRQDALLLLKMEIYLPISKSMKKFFLLTLFFAARVLASFSATYYVAVNGKDDNPGTL
jgi:hypothetical protein